MEGSVEAAARDLDELADAEHGAVVLGPPARNSRRYDMR